MEEMKLIDNSYNGVSQTAYEQKYSVILHIIYDIIIGVCVHT